MRSPVAPVDRRSFLRRAGATTAAATAATMLPGVARSVAARAQDDAPSNDAGAAFQHGVASGDPLADRVVLWTRVTPPADHDGSPIEVVWTIWTGVDRETVVATGNATANAERDFTVKVDPTGLDSATTYYYAFRAMEQNSILGRTRTAPADGDVTRLRFGVVSCSNFTGGYFNAYGRVADRDDLDAVIHLGDYLYEYGNGADRYGPGEGELVGTRDHVPETEMVSLDDYRARHGHYKRDPDLMLAHQRHPFITTWDDHESTNNSHREGAENHEPDEPDYPNEEGVVWDDRRAASARAYDEWMPLRLGDPSEPIDIYRTLAYGDLVDLIVMDTRLEGRDPEVGTTGATIVSGMEIDDPDRVMFSDDQRDLVFGAIANSDARWKVVCQQVILAQWNAGGLPDLSALAGQQDFPAFFLRDGGNALNPDQWDGYTAERDRFFANIRDNEVENVVVLTGDVHTSWANELTQDPYNPATYDPTGQNPLIDNNLGVEFVTPSITSANFERLGPGADAAALATMADNPHVKYTDFASHGYLVLDLDADRAQADWFYVDTVLEPSTAESFGAGWQTPTGTQRLQQAEVAPDGESRTNPPAGAVPEETPAADPTTSATPAPATTASPTPGPASSPTPAPAASPTTQPAPRAPSERLPSTGGGAAAGLAAVGAAALLATRRRRHEPRG